MARSTSDNIWIFVIICTCEILSLEDCKDNGAGMPYPVDDLRTIIPLKLGASWTYREISTDTNDVKDTAIIIERVIGEEDSLSQHYYVMEQSRNGSLDFQYYETISADQYVRYALRPKILLQTPVERGSIWPVSFPRFRPAASMEIMSADTSIRLIDRTYEHVIAIREFAGDYYALGIYFIAPEIGIIHEVHDYSSFISRRELMSINF